MRVTRDVVMDLLPLYVAGEACADTAPWWRSSSPEIPSCSVR